MFMAMAQFAADSGGASLSDPFTYLTGLGFPGVIIGLLITGQLRTKTEVERLVADLVRKDEIIALKDQQIAALQGGIVDKAIPALTRSTQILESLPHADTNLFDQLTAAQRDVSELASRLEKLSRGDK